MLRSLVGSEMCIRDRPWEPSKDPLHYAIVRTSSSSAAKSGETLEDYHAPDSEGNYPIHVAAECDYFFVAKILLDQFPDSKYCLNTRGKFPYHLPDDEAVKKLLEL
eukprot:TRINITY_DN9271_c0_g1_i3.p1 TRINITY_DN9271_c0_g1~~TRINITY_DN9271_c0_g1_i3.p1  ORF type:complete len:106 (+),score=20.51 TRINITY_DN9271_c0_g1_i3:143-460(+)